MRLLLTALLLVLFSGCSTVDMRQYSTNEPTLDLFAFFQGETKGWGIVQDRKGTLTRQFTVDIRGTVNSSADRLTLEEDFNWSDGEKSKRTWVLSRINAHNLTGTAEDVINEATGTLYGNVLNWQYKLNLKVDDTTWKITFDDWMFLVREDLLLNRAIMSKFGLKVGEVTIVFQKNNTL
ncbi:MAG: DUF3833 domain-containing protein [Desulforhopalus sp.]